MTLHSDMTLNKKARFLGTPTVLEERSMPRLPGGCSRNRLR